MLNGILVFVILLITALAFIAGAGVAMCVKTGDAEQPEQPQESKMERQWVSFLSYDGNERE